MLLKPIQKLLFSGVILGLSLTILIFMVSRLVVSPHKQEIRSQAALESFSASISVNLDASPLPISPNIWGVNLYYQFDTITDFYKNFPKETFKNLGIKQIRVGGCHADHYNWRIGKFHYLDRSGKEILANALTPEEILTIAEENNLSVLYTLNMETKGLPNPCGQTPLYPGQNLSEAERKAILLKDATDLLTTYKGRLRFFELGNEHWGAWNPKDYVRTAKEFALALKTIDNTIHISLTGFPTTGNNQNPNQPSTPQDIEWTQAVKDVLNTTCNGLPCFDTVTDHPYVISGYDPLALNFSWNVEGLGSYFAAWQWDAIFGKRNADYAPKKLAITEWNQICWGKPQPIEVIEPSFEGTTANANWGYWSNYPNIGARQIVSTQAHTGNKSVKVSLQNPSGNPLDQVETFQIQPVPATNYIQVYAWVKTASPVNAELVLQQANAGPNQGHDIAYENLQNITPDAWKPVMAIGKPFPDTSEVRIALRVSKSANQWQSNPSPAEVFFDDISFNHYPTTVIVPSTNTIEQGLFAGETLLKMAQNQIYSSSYHSSRSGNPCGLIDNIHSLRSTGQVFKLTSPLAGGLLLPTSVITTKKNIPENTRCYGAMCLRGPAQIDYVSAYSGYSPNQSLLYVFLINRHASKKAAVTLSGLPYLDAQLTLLSANDYLQPTFSESQQIIPGASPLHITLPPVSIARLTMVPSCRIQGYKKSYDGSTGKPFADQVVTLNNPSSSTTTNPYYLSFKIAQNDQRTVSVTEPTGYVAGYTVCFNQINCHDQTPTPGRQFTFTDAQVINGVFQSQYPDCFVDLWWHFSPPASPCAKPLNINLSSKCTSSGDINLICSWDSVAFATEYRGQIDDENTFSPPMLRNSLSNQTSRNITGVSPNQTYFCRARVTQTSADCSVPGTWSETASYTPQSCPLPTLSPSPSASPSYTISDLISLLNNFLGTNDANYQPSEGKINMMDAGWVIKWLKTL